MGIIPFSSFFVLSSRLCVCDLFVRIYSLCRRARCKEVNEQIFGNRFVEYEQHSFINFRNGIMGVCVYYAAYAIYVRWKYVLQAR